MLHVSRVSSVSSKYKVWLRKWLGSLPRLGLWNQLHLFKTEHFKKESGLLDVSHIFLDASVGQSKLAVLLLHWILKYVLDDSVHNLDALKEARIRLKLDTHVKQCLTEESV